MKYRAEIDGLRAVAVIPVILFHAGYSVFDGGFVGVDVFFVISGYLITTILVEDIVNDRFSMRRFYERRARRILPILYTVVLLTLIASFFILYPANMISLGKSAISIPFFSSNFYFWSERGYFAGGTDLKPLVHTWSLAVEEQFYIVFPFFLLFMHRFGSKALLWTMFGIFVVSLIASYFVTQIHFDTAFYFPFTRAWELLMGSFCALILIKRPMALSQTVADVLSGLGLALVFYAYLTFDSRTLFPSITAFVPTIGTAIFIVSSQRSRLFRGMLSSSVVVYVGLISYSLYLWHQPIFSLARHLSVFEENVLLLIVASALVSVMSYHFLEKPFRNSDRVSTKTIVAISFAGAVLIVLLGGLIVLKNGFPSRYAPADQRLLIQLSDYKGYNQARFDDLKFREFSSDEATKVVLIGDSFAKDFMNIVAESDMFENYEFSTRQINSECGNLLLPRYEEIEKNIPENRVERCNFLGRYEGEAFDEILAGADEIWIVSAWKDWVVEYLPRSLENIRAKYPIPVRVIGYKDFGPHSGAYALSVQPDQRPEYAHPVVAEAIRISDLVDEALGSYEFYYPIMDDLCGGDRHNCHVFTEEGLLMSADGGHLTKEGAIEAGRRLRATLLSIKAKP